MSELKKPERVKYVRVSVDLPEPVFKELERIASKIVTAKQSLIKAWIIERLERMTNKKD